MHMLKERVHTASVDLLLTDPPYGMSFQSGARKEKYNLIQGDDSLEWLPDWLREVRRVMKPTGHLYIFCSWHKIDVFKQAIEKHWPIKNILVWNKKGGGMGDLAGGYGGCHEFILFVNLGKDLNGRRDTDVIDGAYRTGNEFHPTQKPVNLMAYLIEKSSSAGDLVLDCFAGSAPVALACVETGRRFIGSEISLEYFIGAIERIDGAKAQGRLF